MSGDRFKKYGTPIDALLSTCIDELQTDRFIRNSLSPIELGHFYYYLNAGLEWFKTHETTKPDI